MKAPISRLVARLPGAKQAVARCINYLHTMCRGVESE